MEQNTAHDAADTLTELITAVITGDTDSVNLNNTVATRDAIRELGYELEVDPDESVTHSAEVGDYYLDAAEPTPSPEANTVVVTELTNQRADEYETDEGKLVSEYPLNGWYPDDDPVVIGEYPNMSSEKEFAFPESRLREV